MTFVEEIISALKCHEQKSGCGQGWFWTSQNFGRPMDGDDRCAWGETGSISPCSFAYTCDIGCWQTASSERCEGGTCSKRGTWHQTKALVSLFGTMIAFVVVQNSLAEGRGDKYVWGGETTAFATAAL